MGEYVNPKYSAAVAVIRSLPKLPAVGTRRVRLRAAVVVGRAGEIYVAGPAGGRPAAE